MPFQILPYAFNKGEQKIVTIKSIECSRAKEACKTLE